MSLDQLEVENNIEVMDSDEFFKRKKLVNNNESNLLQIIYLNKTSSFLIKHWLLYVLTSPIRLNIIHFHAIPKNRKGYENSAGTMFNLLFINCARLLKIIEISKPCTLTQSF